jgi:hypothetical protein
MRPSSRLLVGTLGVLALLGCSSSYDHRGPFSSYLVNAIAVADLDGNGLPDILGVVSRDVDGQPVQGYVSTRLQNTDGTFILPTRFGVGRAPANLVVADLNGDGRPDLVVANVDDHSVIVRLADPARPGYFLPAIVLPLGGGSIPLDVAVGDLNGDGKPDIAIADSETLGGVLILLQDPASPVMFGGPIAFPVTGDAQAVTVADLDGNGLDDIAVATSANMISVILQIAPSTWSAAVDYPTGVQPVAIKAADVNGDGKLDLLTANYGAALSPGTQGLSVLLQGAPGSFLAPVHYDTGYRATALAVGDLNGDGKPDVVVTNSGLPGDPGSVSVLLQDAVTPGTLLPATNYRGAWGPMGVAIADMDGDGLPDLVVADGDITVRYNRTATPGTFDPPTFFYN